MLTIDEAILVLQGMREKSILGGETVLVVSLTEEYPTHESGIEEMEVESFILQQTGRQEDGATVAVTAHPPGSKWLAAWRKILQEDK